jgi:O-antigen/teichoic acid export membrane protein
VYLYQVEISNFILSPDIPENLLLIVFVGASVASLSDYYFLFLKNSGLAKSYVFLMIFRSIIYFIISITLLFLSSLKELSLAYALLVSNTLIFILIVIVHGNNLPFSFNKIFLKDMLKISIPLTPRIFFGVLSSQVDKILLGLIGSTELVGIYSIGQKISSLSYQFMNALGKVFQPELFRKLFSNKSTSESYEITHYIMPFFYISILAALLIVILAKDAITFFVAKEYSEAILVTIVLSVFYASLFFPKIFGNQLIYAKKPLVLSVLTLVGIGLNASLNIPFIQNWGINGAAWATAIASIMITCVTYFYAQRYANILWEWRKIGLIYSVFSLGLAIAIIESFAILNINNLQYLIGKFIIVGIYIFLGFKLNILNRSMLGKFS